MRYDGQADEVKSEKENSAVGRECNPFLARLFFAF
jgi:hypothetical protein